MKCASVVLLLTLALPALAGDKANPYQVNYLAHYGMDGVSTRIQNGMDVGINVVLENMSLPINERVGTYSVAAHSKVDTAMPYDNTKRYACIAPAWPRASKEVGSEGFVCQ